MSIAGYNANSAEVVQHVTSLTSDLLETFSQPEPVLELTGIGSTNTTTNELQSSTSHFHKRIREHLRSCYEVKGSQLTGIKNPVSITFDASCEWMNSSPLCLSTEASSSIIIFEFFTHCCINCIHSINELRQILNKLKTERKLHHDGSSHASCDFKLVSIHSPKFTREQDPESVRSFVQKLSMGHSAVVNDPNRTIWEKLGICCWPTVLVFGRNPNPPLSNHNELNLIFGLLGEGHGAILKTLLEVSTLYFNEVISSTTRANEDHPELHVYEQKLNQHLLFPGKVCIRNGQVLVISDSGNNRILVATLAGVVQEVIGSGLQGFADGHFSVSKFSNPQGIAFESDTVLYVADTGNHAIRRIDLLLKEVTTLVAPNTKIIMENGNPTTLKSPWDLAFYGSDALLIAGAGNHQIFGYFFQPTELFRVIHDANSLKVIAGTGREENRNNSYILKSAFAQPSGISVANGLIFIADSESSSIRMIERSGKVVGLVGGSRDPTDLFAFGDEDGISFEAELQHPVGVCAISNATKVFVADTFNHKIKMVEVDTKRCRTIIGEGIAGDRIGSFSNTEPKKRHSPGRKSPDSPCVFALLNEPGGVSFDDTGELLYIADTNNHKIKVASITNRTVTLLELQWDAVNPEPITCSTDGLYVPCKVVVPHETFEVPYSENTTINLQLFIFNLPLNCDGGEWKTILTNATFPFKSGTVEVLSDDNQGSILIDNIVPPETSNFEIDVNLFFCSKTTCYMRSLHFECHLKKCQITPSDIRDDANLNPVKLTYTIPSTLFQE